MLALFLKKIKLTCMRKTPIIDNTSNPETKSSRNSDYSNIKENNSGVMYKKNNSTLLSLKVRTRTNSVTDTDTNLLLPYYNINYIRNKEQKCIKKQNILNNFVIEKNLNDGYSGKVYIGYEKKNSKKRKVVIKFCHKLSSWETETGALENLKHPNIIKMVGNKKSNIPCPDFIKNDLSKYNLWKPNENTEYPPVHVLVQEFAEKGDLYQFLLENILVDENRTRKLVKPIVEALVYAYEKHSISHRDIKLENILIMKDGTIKLGDWGLAAFKTNNRKCSTSCGTLGYMAPEIICQKKYDANKTDVWALGVVLFSLCSGVRPYGEPKNRKKSPKDISWKDEWLDAIMNRKWAIWWKSHERSINIIKSFSVELRDMIECIFEPDSNKRISLSELLKHPWMKKEKIN
jgi:serine/threonine protein kinase